MEEKKLTDEEIIKGLENWILHDCTAKQEDLINALDLINRLQAEKEELKNEYVKLDLECKELQAENAELKSNKFGNWKVKFYKAQEEIERLTAEIDRRREMMSRMDCNYATELHKNKELQKQMDELKGQNEWLTNENTYLKQCADAFLGDYKNSVKDTAKEILQELWDETEPMNESHKWVRLRIKNIAMRKGVEVE